MMKTVMGIHLNDMDTCVTIAGDVEKGDTVSFAESGSERMITSKEDIPKWHKIAVKSVKKGEGIYKYGAIIGIAAEDIEEGRHIHVHNIHSRGDNASSRENNTLLRGDNITSREVNTLSRGVGGSL